MELKFRKSSYSGEGGQCVEVANALPHIVIRDSKNPDGPTLVFPAEEFTTFLRSLKATTR